MAAAATCTIRQEVAPPAESETPKAVSMPSRLRQVLVVHPDRAEQVAVGDHRVDVVLREAGVVQGGLDRHYLKPVVAQFGDLAKGRVSHADDCVLVLE